MKCGVEKVGRLSRGVDMKGTGMVGEWYGREIL